MEIDIINDASPIDFVKSLLTSKATYAKYTRKLKERSFFMAQRMLAKQYPVIINHANLNGIDRVAILDLYHYKLCKDGGMIPRWLYTKGGDDSKITKEEKLFREIKGTPEICDMMLNMYDIELRSLGDMILRDYNFIESEYKRIIDAHEGKIKKKRQTRKL